MEEEAWCFVIIIVDTHALIWYIEDSARLGKKAKAHLESAQSRLMVSVIVLGEYLFYLKKRKMEPLYDQVFATLQDDRRFQIIETTSAHVRAIPEGLEMHDGLIAAVMLDYPGSIMLSQDHLLKAWGKDKIVWN